MHQVSRPDENGNPTKVWRPSRFTLSDRVEHDKPVAVCILNQPIRNRNLLLKLCEKAVSVVCADGGANRLKALQLSKVEESRCHVASICGDLDSIRPDVLAYYEQRGVGVTRDRDQNSTDLMKSLKYLSQQFSDTTVDVVLFGGLGGRADQAFSLLHQLYANASSTTKPGIGDLYLVTSESILFLLERGHNRILTPVSPGRFTPNVGIIPLGQSSVITTHGLEWDVKDWPTAFGGQLSTSNHIISDVVEVHTTERVIFTMEFFAKD